MIDLRTIHITAAISACLCLYMLLIQMSTPGLRGVRLITWGYACSAVGTELLALRGHIPGIFSIVLANTLLVVVNVFLYWGIAELLHLRKPEPWLLPASLLPVIFICLYFTYAEPSVPTRIIGISAVTIAQQALIVHLLSGRGPQRIRIPRIGLAVLFTLYALLSVVRCWKADLLDPRSVFHNTGSSAVIFFTPILVVVMNALGILWLAMAQLQHELETQSQTDSLTGLLNRRALEQVGAEAIEQARRDLTHLSLIILDLDRFKSINDMHGHDGGDAVLHQTAQCLRDNLRDVEHIARLGGEEFVIFLPKTPQRRAAEIAELLRIALADMSVEHHRQQIRLSASFGVATLLPSDTTWLEILRRGDRALYQAKEQGRDRVAVL